jgi:hypothetical protein
MSTYIPAEDLREIAEQIIDETKERLIIIYPFNDVPELLLSAVAKLTAGRDANIVIVFNHLTYRRSLARIAAAPVYGMKANIEIRVVNRLYNCCFVNKHKGLVILPDNDEQFSNAHFGWMAEVNGHADDMYFETLLYVNDVVKKSHKIYG